MGKNKLLWYVSRSKRCHSWKFLTSGQVSALNLCELVWTLKLGHVEFIVTAIRLEAIASGRGHPSRLEAIASRLEAIASRLEAIAIRFLGDYKIDTKHYNSLAPRPGRKIAIASTWKHWKLKAKKRTSILYRVEKLESLATPGLQCHWMEKFENSRSPTTIIHDPNNQVARKGGPAPPWATGQEQVACSRPSGNW